MRKAKIMLVSEIDAENIRTLTIGNKYIILDTFDGIYEYRRMTK